MCDAADLSLEDTVVEVGPGLGTLTVMLAAKAKQVVAVELDKQLAADLPKRVTVSNLETISQDILKFNFSVLAPGYKVVANIPYYLTSHLIRILSEIDNPPERAVLLVQREVARRVAAEPNDMSLLAVTAQFYNEISLGPVVPARLFTPPPKVDSQVLILTHRSVPLYPDIDPKAYFRVVKAGFSQRRKTLLNSLSAGLHLSKEKTATMLQHSGVDPGARAQALSLGQWQSVLQALQQL